MPAVQHVLVIGAGPVGLTVAALLADGGVAVDVVEKREAITAVGAGLLLQNNALRVIKKAGLFSRVTEAGHVLNTFTIRRADAEGSVVMREPFPRASTDAAVPGAVAISRPRFARFLQERVGEAGVKLRLGCTFRSLHQRGDSVRVELTDGSHGDYDLVIGADGVGSAVRDAAGITGERITINAIIWRFLGPPVDGVDDLDQIHGSRVGGLLPIGKDVLYGFVGDSATALPNWASQSADAAVDRVMGIMDEFHGPWDEVRRTFDRGSLRPMLQDAYLADAPWNRGRIVVIGDAAHNSPPTFAQGAAQGLEDALVLAELLTGRSCVDEHLWAEFHARRVGRARTVLQASVARAKAPAGRGPEGFMDDEAVAHIIATAT
ncbi:FAD-dependent oxidoreductase [Streptomyces sp. A012304]|nr:FAD-dependent oxidoreductase [Streptomyces sp. A012304]